MAAIAGPGGPFVAAMVGPGPSWIAITGPRGWDQFARDRSFKVYPLSVNVARTATLPRASCV